MPFWLPHLPDGPTLLCLLWANLSFPVLQKSNCFPNPGCLYLRYPRLKFAPNQRILLGAAFPALPQTIDWHGNGWHSCRPSRPCSPHKATMEAPVLQHPILVIPTVISTFWMPHFSLCWGMGRKEPYLNHGN